MLLIERKGEGKRKEGEIEKNIPIYMYVCIHVKICARAHVCVHTYLYKQ